MAEQSRTESELSSDEWAARLKKILNKGSVTDDPPPTHVPKALLSDNEAQYIPQFVSLGPHHNLKLKDFRVGGLEYDEVTKLSIHEAYKMDSAAQLSEYIITHCNGRLDLDEMVAMIESMRNQFQFFYKWPETIDSEYFSYFALMIILDSLFLLYFLSDQNQGEGRVRIYCDILKLENQIPLFVLKQFFVNFKLLQKLCLKSSIGALLQRAYKKLCPFDVHNVDAAKAEDEPHLLASIHAIVSPFLKIDGFYPAPMRPQRALFNKICGIFFCFKHPIEEPPIKAYNACQLSRAGITFKSFSTPQETIRFDQLSHTIYLPRMTVSSVQTEMFFRNLHALEFIDTDRPPVVTNFIQLMDCLIDTTDDVEVLKKSFVITYQSMLPDNEIVKIWQNMRRPFIHDRREPPKHLKLALDHVLSSNYCKMKIKSSISESFNYYYLRYFSKPWSFIAFLFAAFILGMNMVQAYCSLRECHSVMPK